LPSGPSSTNHTSSPHGPALVVAMRARVTLAQGTSSLPLLVTTMTPCRPLAHSRGAEGLSREGSKRLRQSRVRLQLHPSRICRETHRSLRPAPVQARRISIRGRFVVVGLVCRELKPRAK
jgi:hypothetical protein